MHNKSLHPIWSVVPSFASCSWGAANDGPPAQTGELNRYAEYRMSKTASLPKVISKLVTLLALVLFLGGCSRVVRWASAEKRPLSYVGKISFANPQVNNEMTTIPFSFTGGEWSNDSAITLYSVDSIVHAQTIEMYIVTALSGSEIIIPELRLSNALPGIYHVVYCDPDGTKHPLGDIVIPTRQ